MALTSRRVGSRLATGGNGEGGWLGGRRNAIWLGHFCFVCKIWVHSKIATFLNLYPNNQ